MDKVKVKPLRVSIVGAGNLGTALALSLSRAGYAVRVLAVRSPKRMPSHTLKLARRLKAKLVALGETALDTDLVWITVPDDVIGAVAARLAPTQEWRGRTVFHSSGALTSDVLAPLRKKGARVASVHPAMTFVHRSMPRLEGVSFGIEGDPAAVRIAKEIVRTLGATPHLIRKENKVLYHAFGSFASPMLIGLMAALEQVGRAAGIKPAYLRTMAAPLLRQTLSNYLEHGEAAAFSGPLVRGDVVTIRRHLEALRKVPQALEVYLALAKIAVKDLPVKNRKALERELSGHRISQPATSS
jgi:predicted short-subunit dehydrogenase-like oxidoreductase (DUF2520 family)